MSKKRKEGWYTDPNGLGHERYWDGQNWSAQTRNEPSPWSKVAPGGGRPQEKSSSAKGFKWPWSKR